MNRQQLICESCGQPVLMQSELPPLTRIQQRILDAVKRRPGISAEQLRCLVWQDDPNGGPECRHTIFVHISHLNNRLAPLGIVVRSEGGGYQIRSVA